MVSDRLKKQIEFIIEIDKLKTIFRQSLITDKSRRENDAEHSWHIALMAPILYEYCDTDKVDLTKVMKMALIHDIIEVYAGDTFAYDTEGYKDKAKREQEAADKIFSLLPDDQKEEYRGLWEEFEAMGSDDAKYAAALDRLQPLLLNYIVQGHTWKLGDVRSPQVYKRIGVLKEVMPELWALVDDMLQDSIRKGYLKE